MSYRVTKSTNKFNAKGRNYNGRWYHSTGEMNYAAQLDWMVKAGEIKSWTPQVKIDLRVNGRHITNYYCDFRVVMKDDSIQYHEYKGLLTETAKIKIELFHALMDEIEPGAELVVIQHKSTWKPK